jgi:hypothetical protein
MDGNVERRIRMTMVTELEQKIYLVIFGKVKKSINSDINSQSNILLKRFAQIIFSRTK